MDQNLSKYAYKLVLDANNKINWQIKGHDGSIKTYPERTQDEMVAKSRG